MPNTVTDDLTSKLAAFLDVSLLVLRGIAEAADIDLTTTEIELGLTNKETGERRTAEPVAASVFIDMATELLALHKMADR